jgi:ribosomal-protein-alanine N-acetyltransferase
MKLWLAPQGLHIEMARLGDETDIARLHAKGFYRGWSVEEFSSYILDEGRTPIYVAIDTKRRIAGFAMIRHLGDEAELITIAVDAKWRKKGIGRALLTAVLADLAMSPAKRLLLEVAADNTAAVRLYDQTGFTKVGERKGYYPRPDGSPATAIVMARDLG